ncbi:MAG: hypothetical protein OER56_15545, partial [Hyphomicrobiales bacterium]|nr:hypothetical protein [Hyphomicrobiales bacterium]
REPQSIKPKVVLVPTDLYDNYHMLQLLNDLGAVREYASAGKLELKIPLFQDALVYPQTPAGDVFRQIPAMLAANC